MVKWFTAAPHVSHRDGNMPVELIGPVHAPGRDGPTNGMYALQKELRKRSKSAYQSIDPWPGEPLSAIPKTRLFAPRRTGTVSFLGEKPSGL